MNELVKKAKDKGVKLVLPVDFVIADKFDNTATVSNESVYLCDYTRVLIDSCCDGRGGNTRGVDGVRRGTTLYCTQCC